MKVAVSKSSAPTMLSPDSFSARTRSLYLRDRELDSPIGLQWRRMADQMTCPWCHETVNRDPENREARFVCQCGWRSWLSRVEELQAATRRDPHFDRSGT